MMRGATRNQQCHTPLSLVWWSQSSSCCLRAKVELRHMHGVWQQCWSAMSASMVGNRFAVLAILLGLRTSFHWAALAKAYKQLWRDFVVTILFAVHVAGAFGFRSLPTTTQVMSTLLSKHSQDHVRDE